MPLRKKNRGSLEEFSVNGIKFTVLPFPLSCWNIRKKVSIHVWISIYVKKAFKLSDLPVFRRPNHQETIISKSIAVLYPGNSGFALGFIFLSPPFSPIRFFLCHFLKLTARFFAIFRQKKKSQVFGHYSQKKSSVFNPLNSGGLFYTCIHIDTLTMG